MFRHTFATSLLEADVDIRYIQEMLGHSSITITEIYTHVAMSKQMDILATKHPRKHLKLSQHSKNTEYENSYGIICCVLNKIILLPVTQHCIFPHYQPGLGFAFPS